MKKLITLAVFDNIFDVKFNLLKEMLDEAGINYLTTNENAKAVKPVMFPVASNLSIELKVYEDDIKEAGRIFQSIK